MSLYFTSLNSGSNGNCYYVANDQDAVLVDAGISCREIEKRMKRLGLSMDKVRAIFVSHEHSDHIRGIPTLVQKYALPVYITQDTLSQCRFYGLDIQKFRLFKGIESIAVGELLITTFPKLHDAVDAHSFVINYKGLRIGVFTDIGAPCKNLATYFRECHAAFLESNYDEDMLENGNYPIYLKRRIRSGKGHLSNKQALNFFVEQRPSFMSHLVLSHLSKENNCPQLVHDLFSSEAAGTEIIVASRYNETPVYTITGDHIATIKPPARKIARPIQNKYPVQASLF